ncbi:hypothetical protein BSLG_001108 [Batrachochytrium salamandrivorans]|nr:hypothetical protein BSLG_001108 [Batrachochytrium salamandrivorans]
MSSSLVACVYRMLLIAMTCTMSSALYKEQAGSYDWHTKLVGIPKLAYIDQSNRMESVIVATNKNVLASLSSDSGDIEAIVTISGDSTTTHLRSWKKQSGALLWSMDEAALTESQKVCRTFLTRQSKNVIAVLPSCDIVAVSEKGRAVWKFKRQAHEESIRVLVTGSSLRSISWTASTKLLTIRNINTDDGSVINSSVVKDVDIMPSNDMFLVGTVEAAHALFTRNGQSYAINLESGKTMELTMEGTSVVVKPALLHASGPEFIVETSTTSSIVRLNNDRLSSVHEFSPVLTSLRSTHVATSTLGGSYSAGRLSFAFNNYIFDYWTSKQGESHISLDSDVSLSGQIQKIFMDVISVKDIPQLALLSITADGSLALSYNGKVAWTRDESLSLIVDAVFLDFPQSAIYSEQLDELSEEPEVSASISLLDLYLRRWSVHLSKLAALADSFIGNGVGSTPESSPRAIDIGDAHGFRKLALFASSTGKVNALDSTTGSPIWSRYFDGIEIQSIHIIRQSRVKYPPLIAIVGMDLSKKNTLIWRVNGLTGEDYVSNQQPDIKAYTKIAGTGKRVAPVDATEADEHTVILAVVDDGSELKLFPDTAAAHAAFGPVCSSFYTFHTVGNNSMQGHSVQMRQEGHTSYKLKSTWNLQFPNGESLNALSDRQAKGNSVASFGRVLGDRTVLYKYLGPNLIGVATLRRDDDQSMTTFFYIIDTVAGSIHYRTAHHGAGPVTSDLPSIHILQSENWFVYTLLQLLALTKTDKGKKARKVKSGKKPATRPAVSNARQLEIVAIEVYENSKPDKRVDGSFLSSYSAARPGIFAQTYTFPLPITAIGVTQTLAGITTREVLLGLEPGFVYGLSKRFLDPRRPYGKISAEDKEVGIYQYAANLGFATREVASYGLEVLGIEKIMSAPTNLESTSLIASYGLDIFCTRRMPSQAFDMLSEDFSYLGLIATIVALVVGIVVAKHYKEMLITAALHGLFLMRITSAASVGSFSPGNMQLNTAVVQAVCWQTDAGHDDDDQQQDNHKEHAQSTSVMPPVRQRLPLSASVPVSFMIQRHTATTINSLTESMPAHSRSWTRPSSICASPDGLLCAVLFPDLLDIRQHRLCVCLFPLPVDAFPEWRRLAWAADASMIAVSFSNGAVLVYSLATKTCICDIQNGHLLHTTPDLMDMASLTIRPLCGLTFAAPQMLSRSNPTQHCLVAVSFDGAIAAYMMDANPLDLVCSWFGSLVDSYSLVSAAVFVDMRLLIAGKQHTPHTSDDPATLSYWDVDYNDNDFVLVGNQSRIRLSSTKAVIPYSLHGLYRLAGSVFAHYGMSTSLDVSGYISQISYCKDSNTLLVLDGCGCFYLYSATELHLRWSSSSDSSPVGKVRSAQFFGAQHLLVSTQELILQQLSIEALLGKEDSSLSSEHSITINQFDSLFVEISTTCREDAIAYILASSAHSNVVDLACLVKVTPEEKIIASIDSLDIHDIEKICRDSNTSTDQVFKSLWLHVKKEPSDTAISYLTRVQDLAFVFSQCFDSQEHNDMILTRILLQHAVARTDQIGYSDVEAELDKILDSYDKTTVASDTASFGKFGGLSATDLCVSRIRALNYLDRLDTLESIYIEGVAYEDYLRLRDIDLIDLACDFASSQKFGALEILFTRHGGELLPYRLGLLDLIPECVSPELYHRLLPCINPVSKSEVPWKIIGWRKVDWSAHKATKELLDLLMKEVSTEDRATQVHVVHSPYPSDEQHILSWYKARILCLENYTYNTQNSMELAEFAVSHGVPHVQPILDRLAILDNLLKHSSYSGDVDKMALDSPFTLSDLMRLDVHDVIELILKNSDEWTIVHDMRKLVQPLLDPSTLFNSKSIVSGLSKLGISNPNAVLAVFQSSSLDVPFSDRLLSSPMMLADIISTICYEHFSDANIPVYEKMLNLALAVLEDSSESVDILEIDGYAIEKLSDLHQLTLRLKGAKILATFGILMTISDLQSMESSDSQQRQLVEKIPRQALLRISLGENKSSRDTLFQSVLIDMLELKAIGILCSISSDDLYTSFLRVAASNGMHSFIQNILLGTSGSSHGIVSLKLCQEVLVSVAREMLDNADSGNKSKGLLKNACDCLTLVEQSPDMKQELELIDALNASSEMILELTRKLCGSETALSLATQLRVRAYMADAAIDEGSVDVAVYYCNELIRLSSSESFLKMSLDTSLVDSLCHVFCKLIELSTHNVRFDEKLAFIVYAIRICQSSSLETMIGHWRKIEFESILHDLEVQKLPLHKKRQNEHGNMASLFNNRAEGQATPLELPNYEALLVNLTTRLKDLDHAEPNPMHSKVSVISMHDFYRSPGSTPSGNFYSLDISTAKRNSDSLNDISSALRCQELRRSYGHNTSDLLLKFAHYSLNHDSLESLGALLSCKPALELQSFFDGFECSEEISKLASHFFVISALYQVFPGIPDTFTLVNMEYSEALKSLTSLISDSENMVLDSSRDTAVKLLEIARLFSTQAQSKRIGAISDRLSLRYQVDLERMREDIQYRNHAFSGLVSSIDSSQLKDCIDVANYLEMDCKAHITWLATSSFVTASQLSTRLQQVSEELNIDQSDIRDILISIHSKLFLSPNDKLLVLYQTLADFLSSDGHNDTSAVEQLKSRMDLLKTILSMEAVADLTLNSLRSSISSDTNGLVALMGPDPSHDRFQGMVSVLQRLDAIRPIALFLDESNLVDLDIDKSAMSSTLHMTYLRNAIARMASDWEFIDSERSFHLQVDLNIGYTFDLGHSKINLDTSGEESGEYIF